jgi:hypothetical protein
LQTEFKEEALKRSMQHTVPIKMHKIIEKVNTNTRGPKSNKSFVKLFRSYTFIFCIILYVLT